MQELLLKTSQSQRLIRKSPNWILQALLFITSVCIFVPFNPLMPWESLDPSWVFGMNQAVAQGLAFGRDIIFSFGPYASIYTQAYHPATDHLMLAGGLYLGISYWIVVFLLTKDSRWYLVFTFLVLLAGLMYVRDALFFSYPLLAGLFCFKVIDSQNRIDTGDKLTLVLIVILFLPFGLLPLIKRSILILCGSIVVLAFVLFLSNKKWHLAIAVAAAPIFSIPFFWVASGQSIFDLPHFFISMIPIFSGYTEAMAKNGENREIIYYLVATFFLLMAVIREKGIPIKSRIYLFCVFFSFLFLAFKGGFVRHDAHAIMSGTSILIAALLFSLTLKSRQMPVVLFVSVFVWVYIYSHYSRMSIKGMFRDITSTYSSAWSGFKYRLANKNWPENDFNIALKTLKEKANFPLLQGTTDIYSYNQSYLISSGNIWNPRPILQSYSVYTPSLAEKNKKHLLGEASPDNVIFRLEPIDGRIPSIEDGASWPVLLSHYQPTAFENDFLYLRKRTAKSDASGLLSMGNGTQAFGDVVVVPGAATPIFAEISITPSLIGQLANLFFKPTQLQISLNLENGTKKTYRLIAGMAKSGLMVSPLIEKTTEFGLLYGDSGYLTDKGVKSISITPVGGRKLWKDNYEVAFKKIGMPPTFDVSKLFKFDKIVDDTTSHQISIADKCDGSIDFVNGVSPAPAQFSASGLLSVHGWLANSIDQGALPESVLLVLSDSKGRSTFIKTRQTPRPDVGAYFKKPTLDASGYTSTADVSMLEGNYTLGLAVKDAEHIKICPQFKIPATLKRTPSHVQQ